MMMRDLYRQTLQKVIISIILFLSVCSAQAREMQRLWKGPRPLGMGGAFTAIADDYNALFYNPAGLDKVDGGFALLNPLVEIGENGQNLYNDMEDTDFTNRDEVTDLLRKHVGEHQHVRVALFPHLIMKHFALGVLGQTIIDAEVNNPGAWPEVDATALGEVVGVGGIGVGFLSDHALRVGLSAKYIQRHQLQETYTAGQIASDDFEDTIEDDLVDGTGFGFDLGLMYTFQTFLKPTAAMVIQNIGGTDLGDAGEIPQQINLGTALFYKKGILSLKGGLDIMDITREINKDESDFFRRLHLGVESWLWKRLALRAGLHQGYASIGATFDLWILSLDYANYAEELGAYAGQRCDRRHVVQLSLGW